MTANRVCGLVLAALGAFALAGVASGAGEIEINDARALAGGVTPGDAPGYPVTISQSGSYVLTGNLTPTGAENGITIENGVSDVLIDLAGFAIVGPVVCTRGAASTTCVGTAGAGVSTQVGNVDITVRDGTVRGMGNGVLLSGSTNARIEGIQATSNASIGIAANTGAILESNIADLNGNSGFVVNDNNTLRNNIATRNGSDGLFVGRACTLIGNVANTNLRGIRGPGGSTFIGNTMRGNVSNGFVPGGGAASGYAKNVLTANNGNALGAQTNPEVSGGTQREIGVNLCGADTVCP